MAMKISAKLIASVLAFIVGSSSVLAQQDRASQAGPYTDQEAQLMIAVWPTVRGAARYEDINWAALSLAGAPGT